MQNNVGSYESMFITDIKIKEVANASECGDKTDEGYQPILDQWWFGLDEGCDCNRRNDEDSGTT